MYGVDCVYASFKEDKMSSMSTFSNWSFTLLVLIKSIMRAKSPHFMRKCLTVFDMLYTVVVSLVEYKSVCVSIVWPMRHQDADFWIPCNIESQKGNPLSLTSWSTYQHWVKGHDFDQKHGEIKINLRGSFNK